MEQWSRRGFGAAALAGLAFAGLAYRAAAGPGATYRNEVTGYGPLRRDPEGFLDLPEGFAYRVISRVGERMDDGFVVPDKFDGMGCLALPGGKLALVRNHELRLGEFARGPTGGSAALERKLAATAHFGSAADGRVMPGGATTVVLDAASGRREAQFLSLAGTSTNCAGGVTPWGSWLSCEETLDAAPQTRRSHGWVFEVPAAARGPAAARPLTAMGRFRHEAAAVDPVSGIVYLTEDRDDGLFYRFVPVKPGELARGGRLQALAFGDDAAGADSRNWGGAAWRPGTAREVRWIDLDEVESPRDDLRARGHARGAVLFARGEGIHLATGSQGARAFFFTCTSGGRARLGQVMRYVPSQAEATAGEARRPGRLDLFVESADPLLMTYADNLAVSPLGHLVLCEDRADGGPNHLRGVTPDGRLYTLARLNLATELAGACFSPDGTTLFVNAYSPGRTVAIRGPWQRFALAKRPAVGQA